MYELGGALEDGLDIIVSQVAFRPPPFHLHFLLGEESRREGSVLRYFLKLMAGRKCSFGPESLGS